jgi:hypothetical protein
MNVAILITTFNRNARLLRAVKAVCGLIEAYRGPNRYFVCVADSNRDNAVKLPAGVSRLANAGEGFDDNLLGAFRFLAGAADFVFAMADDDLMSPLNNPLTLIDAAIADATGDVVLFNNISYDEHGAEVVLGGRFYSVAETVNLAADPLPLLCGRLPRYAGILYRSAFVESIAGLLQPLRGSLHAYAAPLFIAADRGRFQFIDHGIVLFHDAAKSDGAWESAMKVHQGLMLFLQQMKPCLSASAHENLVRGLYHVFFRINRKSVWRAELPGVPDFATLADFEAHLEAWRPDGLLAA